MKKEKFSEKISKSARADLKNKLNSIDNLCALIGEVIKKNYLIDEKFKKIIEKELVSSQKSIQYLLK